jgi:hypothetical protein
VTTYELGHEDIEALPQGSNTPIDKVLLQAPGVTQDSAASGNLHVRNDHANLQYRINGIIIPDGVSGFGQLLETSFAGSASLITGRAPSTVSTTLGSSTLRRGAARRTRQERSVSTAVATTRSRRASNTADPAAAPNTSSPVVASSAIWGSRIRRQATTRSTTRRSREGPSPMRRRCSTIRRG